MVSEIYFFTTKTDIIRIIQKVEQKQKLKYIEMGSYDSKDIKILHSMEEYVHIGINLLGDHQSQSFIVLERNDILHIREVEQIKGGMKYCVDQMENMDSIILWTGGTYEEKYLICGHIGTIHKTPKSKELLHIFQKVIKKECSKKVGRYYIGNEAMKQSDKFRFITMNVNQPEEYDINIL